MEFCELGKLQEKFDIDPIRLLRENSTPAIRNPELRPPWRLQQTGIFQI